MIDATTHDDGRAGRLLACLPACRSCSLSLVTVEKKNLLKEATICMYPKAVR